MSLHPGTNRYNPAGNSDFTRKAEALALGITNWSTPKATDGAKGGPGQSYGSGGTPPLPAQAAQWPTPAAQNWKGSSEASITRADGKKVTADVTCRIDTMDELDYYKNGGIMPYVLRNLARAA